MYACTSFQSARQVHAMPLPLAACLYLPPPWFSAGCGRPSMRCTCLAEIKAMFMSMCILHPIFSFAGALFSDLLLRYPIFRFASQVLHFQICFSDLLLRYPSFRIASQVPQFQICFSGVHICFSGSPMAHHYQGIPYTAKYFLALLIKPRQKESTSDHCTWQLLFSPAASGNLVPSTSQHQPHLPLYPNSAEWS